MLIVYILLSNPYLSGISFQESPEWFEWFVDFKGKTSNSTITEEIIPCLAKISGLLHKLGEVNIFLYVKKSKKKVNRLSVLSVCTCTCVMFTSPTVSLHYGVQTETCAMHLTGIYGASTHSCHFGVNSWNYLYFNK